MTQPLQITPRTIKKALFAPPPEGFADKDDPDLINQFGSRRGVVLAAVPFISKDQIAFERELLDTVWPLYAFMSPYKRTDMFMDGYRRFHREVVAAKGNHSDRTRAQLKNTGIKLGSEGLARGPLFSRRHDKAEITALWGLRQRVDQEGLPYHFFFDRAVEFFKSRSFIPRPNQMASDKHFDGLIKYCWLKAKETPSLLMRADDPRFKNENFQDHPAQKRFHQIILKLLKAVSYPESWLNDLIFHKRILPESVARAKFGDDAVDDAKAQASNAEKPSPDQDLSFKPGCFGYYPAYEARSASCVTCSFAPACDQVGQAIRQISAERFGSDSPFDDRKKLLARERQRKHRALKAERQKTGASETREAL